MGGSVCGWTEATKHRCTLPATPRVVDSVLCRVMLVYLHGSALLRDPAGPLAPFGDAVLKLRFQCYEY